MGIEPRLEIVEQKIDGLDMRLYSLEQQAKLMNYALDTHTQKIETISATLEILVDGQAEIRRILLSKND